jgi:phage FluMu gp28-like protein
MYPAVILELLTELDAAPTKLEPYQVRWLNDRSDFRLANKSRQIGLSTIIAAEGFAKALVATKPYKANYVSINQTEAADKIEIARNLYHSIPDAFAEGDDPIKKVLWKDSEHEFALGRPPYVSTLISQPASSAIRGGRKDIYFDEFAHIRDAKKLYTAAMPAITRGGGRLSIVSTPLGQNGLFYDIATDVASYPQYSRHAIPWWECSAMVKLDMLAEAYAMAGELDTEARVRKYGTDKLLTILQGFGGDLLSFQMEYEASFIDESEAYYPWELVVNGRDDEQRVWASIPAGWEPEGQITVGVDLAKERDESVFTVVEHRETPEGERVAMVRFMKTSQDTYLNQAEYLIELVKRVKAARVSIDATGPGAMFVEKLKASVVGSKVEGVTFTSANKEQWATKFKGELQSQTIQYPNIPMLLRQIHGIKRTKTESGLYKFSGGSGAKRDDYFWSLMLALYGQGRASSRISALGGR